ncbi:LysR family transcriptional regulator [Hydrogenophaga sp. SNF1]|uniref:LysR family transcriptional regulator n=1 Tax=Hydrogenophaga sp. SNF1 TaxID=3098762 RepID=UPI002ACBFDEB|nr:LysR family transcriptional regulator [Hydrogenophaga sp. SNF1]WQB84712.1 LysR family transcriptional regulator [Hydrogenophaga sp. SNF1]
MRTRLSIQELEAVVDVAETLSFRASAQRSFVSQPALSRTIAAAESKLGTRLFDRNTRHVQLTAAGRELLPVAQRIVFELRDSLSDLSEFVAGRTGEFTIASVPAVAAAVLPQPMQAFLQRHPKVGIKLLPVVATDVLNMVASGSAQVGFCSLPPDEPEGDGSRFEFTAFSEDDLMLLCSSQDAMARRKGVTLEAFEQRPYIANGPASSLRPMVERLFVKAGLAVKPRYESANISVTAAMVAAGLGVAAVPALTSSLMNTAGLSFVPIQPRVSRALGVLTRRGRSLSRAVELFMEEFYRFHATALGPTPTADGDLPRGFPKGFRMTPVAVKRAARTSRASSARSSR